MLNAIENHGFIHRSGLNISIDELVDALDDALNLAPDSSLPVAQLAATTSTTGNPNTMNLDDLNKHGGKAIRDHANDGPTRRGASGNNISFSLLSVTYSWTISSHPIAVKL